jgi:hypothetical protein
MSRAPVDIANLSLSHLGVGKRISDLDENSAEANALSAFYDLALEQSLRAVNWPFATKFVTLALVESDPTDEWGYSYRYPSDCLYFRRILSGSRQDTRQSRISYKIGIDNAGQLVYTDQSQAQAEYTMLVRDPQRWPSDFAMAFSYLLAALIAPRLSGGDPTKRGEAAREMYEMEIRRARANAWNEEQPDEEVETESIRARES